MNQLKQIFKTISADRVLRNGGSETFDFVYIDADKANYENYYDRAIQLIRKGGVIAVDNVSFKLHLFFKFQASASTNVLLA